jgi:hypothetical protein
VLHCPPCAGLRHAPRRAAGGLGAEARRCAPRLSPRGKETDGPSGNGSAREGHVIISAVSAEGTATGADRRRRLALEAAGARPGRRAPRRPAGGRAGAQRRPAQGGWCNTLLRPGRTGRDGRTARRVGENRAVEEEVRPARPVPRGPRRITPVPYPGRYAAQRSGARGSTLARSDSGGSGLRNMALSDAASSHLLASPPAGDQLRAA